MFSNIDQLKINESIFISDINKKRIEYVIYDKYSTDENNLTCTKNTKNIEITLVTCNKNNNKKRIVIKAKMKES